MSKYVYKLFLCYNTEQASENIFKYQLLNQNMFLTRVIFPSQQILTIHKIYLYYATWF